MNPFRCASTNAARVLSLLATWLGHSDAAHTYWYLTATGELMARAAGMLEPVAEGDPS